MSISTDHPIYLDYAAATPLWPEVKAVINHSHNYFGNPGSLHQKGVEAKKLFEEAQIGIARQISAKPSEIYFTSGATESNNLAILGICSNFQNLVDVHIITSAVEHPSVLEPIRSLEAKGAKVTYLNVNREGLVNLKELEDSLDSATKLVSIMAANNEIGTIQPITKIAKIIRAYQKQHGTTVYFHTDAAQYVAWHRFGVNDLDVDLLTLSAAKVGGGHGVGLLYVKKGTRINPIIFGGGQQNNLRSGTQNVAGASVLVKALEVTWSNLEKSFDEVKVARDKLVKILQSNFPKSFFNQSQQSCLPNFISWTVPGLDAEVALYNLSARGIYVSTGSACSTANDQAEKHVLEAIGLSANDQRSTLRITLGWSTTASEVEAAVEVMIESIKHTLSQQVLTSKLEEVGKTISQNYE